MDSPGLFLSSSLPDGGLEKLGFTSVCLRFPFLVKLKRNEIFCGTMCGFVELIVGRTGNIVEVWS